MIGQQNYTQLQRYVMILIIAAVLIALALAVSDQVTPIAKAIATNIGLIAPAFS